MTILSRTVREPLLTSSRLPNLYFSSLHLKFTLVAKFLDTFKLKSLSLRLNLRRLAIMPEDKFEISQADSPNRRALTKMQID